ncbi:caspase-3-like isoform X2 [Biomphalaria pfeifferi]|uniref:Caspase-3-like isoform X2 n=1 Tax=Biomphalaria pfeifferi TaxID=112525 RepID=A0AAD8FC87_BIOPF|nr:caspase-3-like isoform X2 [Biomphalaria pfeifferi]
MDDSEDLPISKSSSASTSEVNTKSNHTYSTPKNRKMSISSFEYDFSNERRGIAIIIVNDKYQGSNKREGCEKDKQLLQTTFAQYGFEIRCFCDKKAADLIKELNNISKEDHSKSDCLVIAITAHGEEFRDKSVREDLIYTTDKIITTRLILELFSDSNCKSLIGKPRLVFIQACRGTKMDDGAQVKYRSSTTSLPQNSNDLIDCVYMRTDNSDMSDAVMEDDIQAQNTPTDTLDHNSDLLNPSTQVLNNQTQNLKLKTAEVSPFVNHAPCYKDFLVMYATPTGYYAFRRTTDGSWFIKSLCDVLNEQSDSALDGRSTKNLLTVLTNVISRVAREMVSKSANKHFDAKKQSPVIYSRLTKDVFLTKKN